MKPEEHHEQATVFPGFAGLSDDVREVVTRLADMRRERGLSQTEIAARMRTSQSAVARLEAGRDDIRLSTLQRYAQALGHTVHFGVAPTDEATT
jgi:transcriptional regulator with XRE-family HTH domain